MANEPSPVVTLAGATAGTTRVYHRDFPEIRADGETPRAAAEHLAHELTRALDSALTDWRRQTLNRAVDEVRAFIAQAPSS